MDWFLVFLLITIAAFYLAKPPPKQSRATKADLKKKLEENSSTVDKAVRIRERTKEALQRKQETRGAEGSFLPPGQKLSKNWPTLDLGVPTEIDLQEWSLEITGLEGGKTVTMSLDELKGLGVQRFRFPLHCVTSWSVMDLEWTGVSLLNVIRAVKPLDNWKCLMQHGLDGYTVNVSRGDVERDDVFIAWECNGAPISKKHGYIRLMIPSLYGWKGCKFLGALEFLLEEQKGFWEQRGAHMRGRVDLEERWAEDDGEKKDPMEIIKMSAKKKKLDLSNCGLTEIPMEVFEMTHLESLRLENNQISVIPPQIANLKKLGVLVLSQNKLTSIPPEIGELENLVELFLINNQITSIPRELTECAELMSLWLDNNKIESVPAEMARLEDLRALSLDNNQIREMPKELSRLIYLRSFSFRKNPVRYLPPEYHVLERLAEGWLGFDSVENVPEHIVTEGVPAVLKELKRQFDEQSKMELDQGSTEQL